MGGAVGEAKPFEPEKLVLAVLVSRETLAIPGFRGRFQVRLEGAFGDFDYEGPELPFGFTHYYDDELGTPLVRQLLAFRRLVDPQELAGIKITTNRIEDELRSTGESRTGSRERAESDRPSAEARGPRRVNLDPGLLSLSRLVLASTKDGSHRVPLASGIFAEVTLQYRRSAFRPLPWTYPDYSSEEVLRCLLDIRALLKRQKRGADPTETGSLTEADPPAIGRPRG
jgi:hypothetical protein